MTIETTKQGITPEQYAAAWERAKAANDGTGPVAVRVWDVSTGCAGWALVPDYNGVDVVFDGCNRVPVLPLSSLSLTPPDLGERIAEKLQELGEATLAVYQAKTNRDARKLQPRQWQICQQLNALYAQRDAADHIADANKKVEPDPHPADVQGWRYYTQKGRHYVYRLRGEVVERFSTHHHEWRSSGVDPVVLKDKWNPITPAEARRITGDDGIEVAGG